MIFPDIHAPDVNTLDPGFIGDRADNIAGFDPMYRPYFNAISFHLTRRGLAMRFRVTRTGLFAFARYFPFAGPVPVAGAHAIARTRSVTRRALTSPFMTGRLVTRTLLALTTAFTFTFGGTLRRPLGRRASIGGALRLSGQ